MRYAYCDLGEQGEGSTLTVRWRGGAAADVMLLDPVNFTKYREARLPVMYGDGGRYARPPACLKVPADGRWYVVADLRGYSQFAEATVEVADPQSGDRVHEEQLIGAA